MKISRRKLLFVSGGLLLAVLALAGLLAYPQARRLWQSPLGPGLELPTYTPAVSSQSAVQIGTLPPAQVAQAEPSRPSSSLAATQPASTGIPLPTATPEPFCGGPPVMTILGVGADNRDDTYLYGLGDVIRIARVDFVTPKITVLSMPRDLWVEIPGISDHYDITHGKLNQAYFYGNPGVGYYNGPGAGPGLLARTLDLNFGLRVDHYGAVNMQTFIRIIDAVGGIDIYLPNDVDGRPIDDQTEDMGYFTAGQHHFSGEEALRFSRIRKRYNDFTRMDHQTMVMCAVKDKLLSPSVLPKVPQIIRAFQGSVLTDLSLEQLSQMACLLPKVKRENLVFTSLPQEIMEPSREYSPQFRKETFVLDVDFDVIRDHLARFMAGEWPGKPAPSAEPGEPGGSFCP